MAGLRVGMALAGTFIAVVLLLQLLLTIHYKNKPPVFITRTRGKAWTENHSSDDSIFLLGAGKADITGLAAYSECLTYDSANSMPDLLLRYHSTVLPA